MTRLLCGFAFVVLASFPHGLIAAESADVKSWLDQVRAVKPLGQQHAAAVAAVQSLQKLESRHLPQILAAMHDTNPVVQNWLRGVAETIAARTFADKAPLPTRELEAFLRDEKQPPRGRRLAYEFLRQVDPSVESRILAGLIQDKSLELRRDAVQLLIDAGASSLKDGSRDKAAESFGRAFIHARDLDQIQLIAGKMKELELPYDMPTRMGFLARWKVVGPFDNASDAGWDIAYEPEAKLDFEAEYKGRAGAVTWIDHTTTDEYGMVDLVKVLDKHKGAIAYVATEFLSDREQPVVLRLGCINAHKVWLNGQALGANHVYHSGIEVDQYQFPAQLKAGRNVILMKICQNEQTEPWAQRWQFQLRVSDDLGGAILSQDRLVPKTASRN